MWKVQAITVAPSHRNWEGRRVEEWNKPEDKIAEVTVKKIYKSTTKKADANSTVYLQFFNLNFLYMLFQSSNELPITVSNETKSAFSDSPTMSSEAQRE